MTSAEATLSHLSPPTEETYNRRLFRSTFWVLFRPHKFNVNYIGRATIQVATIELGSFFVQNCKKKKMGTKLIYCSIAKPV